MQANCFGSRPPKFPFYWGCVGLWLSVAVSQVAAQNATQLKGVRVGMPLSAAAELITHNKWDCHDNSAPLGGLHFYCQLTDGTLQIYKATATGIVHAVRFSFFAGGSAEQVVKTVEAQLGVTLMPVKNPSMALREYRALTTDGLNISLEMDPSKWGLTVFSSSLVEKERETVLEQQRQRSPVPDLRSMGTSKPKPVPPVRDMGASRRQLIARIQECWNPPAGGRSSAAVKIVFNLDRNGSLLNEPRLAADQQAVDPVAAESAMRAIRRCSPYNFLPADQYEQWKTMEVSFDPRDIYR